MKRTLFTASTEQIWGMLWVVIFCLFGTFFMGGVCAIECLTWAASTCTSEHTDTQHQIQCCCCCLNQFMSTRKHLTHQSFPLDTCPSSRTTLLSCGLSLGSFSVQLNSKPSQKICFSQGFQRHNLLQEKAIILTCFTDVKSFMELSLNFRPNVKNNTKNWL